MKAPTGTVECRDPQVCRGARFHFSDTVAACGATKSAVRAAALAGAAPPVAKADPNCPRHGIEPSQELEVRPLNRQQIAAGVVGTAAMFGLCSCAGDTTPSPTDSGTPTVEQTVQPSPEVSASEYADPRDDPANWPPQYLDAIPRDLVFPGNDAGYAFSDSPQGTGEQWIFDNHPELWAQGVRVISLDRTLPGYLTSDPKQPAALVQYINGKRYEGAEGMPLFFRGQLDNPETFPTDVYKNTILLLKGEKSPEGEPHGYVGYNLGIIEQISPMGGNGGAEVTFVGPNGRIGEPQLFPDWETAWASLQKNGFQPNAEDARALNPGEIVSVGVMDQGDEPRNRASLMVLNPSTGEFITVKKYK